MFQHGYRYGIILIAWVLAACGSYAQPINHVRETETSEAIVQAQIALGITPTATTTLTTEPTATHTPTPIPATETPTPEPTATFTATAEVVNQSQVLVDLANPENGEVLFNQFYQEAGFACSTCHHVDSEEMLIGPGLLNVGIRGENTVEGQSAPQYIFNSIVNPNDYVVEGFTEGVMPQNWSDILSTSETYDIVAYLMTLEGEVEPVSDAETSDEAAPTSDVPIELLDSADAENGAILFTTFQADAGFACSTCHRAASEDRLIGPGLLNVGVRGASRVDGLSAEEYLYISIINPDAFVVPDYTDDLMPENWADIYSDEEIFDIIAYLLTLEG